MSRKLSVNTRMGGTLDREIEGLLRLMNYLEGVETVNSCAGHGTRRDHGYITFIADQDGIEKLTRIVSPILRLRLDGIRIHKNGWKRIEAVPENFCGKVAISVYFHRGRERTEYRFQWNYLDLAERDSIISVLEDLFLEYMEGEKLVPVDDEGVLERVI